MKRTVTVRLTEAEAMALRYAAGNVMDYPDAVEALWNGEPEKQNIAYSAYQRLGAAITRSMEKDQRGPR